MKKNQEKYSDIDFIIEIKLTTLRARKKKK
jgi:hypothetical protein